jgi:hypothetical protein
MGECANLDEAKRVFFRIWYGLKKKTLTLSLSLSLHTKKKKYDELVGKILADCVDCPHFGGLVCRL